jgi:hypothetical protein
MLEASLRTKTVQLKGPDFRQSIESLEFFSPARDSGSSAVEASIARRLGEGVRGAK